MAVKISSPRAELAVLRAMTHKDKTIAGTMLKLVDEQYFHSPESKELYLAIRRHLTETNEVPSYKMMLEDPDLNENTRDHFRDSQPLVTTVAEAQRAARILNKYRQARGVHSIAVHINRLMQGTKLDTETLLNDLSEALTKLRTKKMSERALTHMGQSKIATETIRSLLFDEDEDDLIPTFVPEFDEEAGGWERGSLVTIGATSGGGKSLAALHIAKKQAMAGYKVAYVTLEMTRKEKQSRLIASLSGISVTKILRKGLTEVEKDFAFKKYRLWERKVHKAGGVLTIFQPEEGVTIEDVYTALSSYGFDVVYIDYIGLLDGTDGDDQVKQLGRVARVGKVNAIATNRVNVLLCQVSEDLKIKYARAISEHSTNSWIWTAPKAEREKAVGEIDIEQPKSRNSRSYPMKVGFEWAFMRIVRASEVSSDVGGLAKPMKNHADI